MPVLTAELQSNHLQFALPKEIMEQMNLKQGDRVEISSEALKRVSSEQADQAALQTQLDAFFERLESTTFEKPNAAPSADPVEQNFAEMMDAKFRKLGFTE